MLQEHILAIGLSSGHLLIFDCGKAEKVRGKEVDDSAITALAFLHGKIH